MPDYGLYNALNTKRDWGQVRKDRQDELALQTEMLADAQRNQQAEAAAREKVQAALKQISDATTLDFDVEKIKGVEQAARKKIIEGINAAGGSYEKFLMQGGSNTINTYYDAIKNSKEMQNAANNKLAFAQFTLSQQAGRVDRPAMVNGQPMTFQQQLELAKNGQLEKLTYGGSVKPLDQAEIRKMIQETYGKNKYKRTAATENDIYNVAKEFGAEDWYAKDLAAGYKKGVESGGQPIYFKSDNYPVVSGGGSKETAGGAEYWLNLLKGAGTGNSKFYSQDNKQNSTVYNRATGGYKPNEDVKVMEITPFKIGSYTAKEDRQAADGSVVKVDVPAAEELLGFKTINGEPFIITNKAPEGEPLTNSKLNQVLQSLVARDIFSQAELDKALKKHPEMLTPEGLVDFMSGGQVEESAPFIEDLRKKYGY